MKPQIITINGQKWEEVSSDEFHDYPDYLKYAIFNQYEPSERIYFLPLNRKKKICPKCKQEVKE